MSRIVVEDSVWEAIMADERLGRARSKLSFHEIRLIIQHALDKGASASSGCVWMDIGRPCVTEGCAVCREDAEARGREVPA